MIAGLVDILFIDIPNIGGNAKNNVLWTE